MDSTSPLSNLFLCPASFLLQNIGHSNRYTPTFLIAPTTFQSSVSALSNRSVSHTDYCALCRVLSFAPTAPALPPGNPALSFYIPRPVIIMERYIPRSTLFIFICRHSSPSLVSVSDEPSECACTFIWRPPQECENSFSHPLAPCRRIFLHNIFC